MIAAWMVFRLTGTLVTKASIGSTSGLSDLGLADLVPDLLMLCGLEPSLFPERAARPGCCPKIYRPARSRMTPGMPSRTGSCAPARPGSRL